MGPEETAAALPGSDAERRAALAWQARLRAAGRDARLETHWVRPQQTLVHAWHAAIGVAGSLVAVSDPWAGLALVGLALVSVALDAAGMPSPARRLTPERATQNVVAESPDRRAPVRLILAASYDAGRRGLVNRQPLRRWLARLPGPHALLAIALTPLLAIAIVRATGSEAGWLGVAQLPSTVALVVGAALALDIQASRARRATGNSALAVSLVDALDRSPPRNLAVDVVLAGAGAGGNAGMSAYVRRRRREGLSGRDAVVLAFGPGEEPRPRAARRGHRGLREIATAAGFAIARLPPGPAAPARVWGWPALTIENASLEQCRALVAAIDAQVASRPR